MSEWWVGRQGSNPVGPVTTDTLIRGILEKKVPEDSLVCRVGEQQWQHIAQVDELWEQVHPEEFRTNITQRPWFAEKGASQPPSSPPVENEVDDESTRIFSVPILPIRSVDSSPSHPVPARTDNPPAAQTAPSTVGANPAAHAAAPAKPNLGSATSPNPGYAQAPKAIISPPRFGLDRSSPANKSQGVTAQTVPLTIRTDPGVAKVVLGPTMPSAPQPVVAIPNRPGIAVPQQIVPEQAPARFPYKVPAEQRAPHGQAEPPPDSVPLVATRPRLPSDPSQNSRPLSQTRPDAPAAQARAEASAPQPLPARAAPRQPTQPQPPIHYQQPIQPQPPIQPRPPNVAPSYAEARAPSTTVEPEEDTVTVITQSAAAVARVNVQAFEHPPPPPTPPTPPKPAPPIREVEPSDLFDEDFEPPPSRPVVHPDHVSVAPRPAAGTPAPPSVIVTHPPPSMHDIVLSHAVASIPEETRPALRSMRPAGTIQVSIGTLIIGALTLVVLVLLVVLLLH